jgi:hypothetical protein
MILFNLSNDSAKKFNRFQKEPDHVSLQSDNLKVKIFILNNYLCFDREKRHIRYGRAATR